MGGIALITDIQDEPQAGTASLDDIVEEPQPPPPVTLNARRGGMQTTEIEPTPEEQERRFQQAEQERTGEGSFLGIKKSDIPSLRDVFAMGYNAFAHPSLGSEPTEAPSGEQVKAGLQNIATPGKRGTGALQLAASATEPMTALVGPATLEAPGRMALGYGESYLAGKGGKYVAKKMGATPEQQQLTEEVAGNIPLIVHAAAAPETVTMEAPGARARATRIFGGKAGYVAGINPDEAAFGVKVGPFEGSVRVPRTRPPAQVPPTLTGEVAPPPSRAVQAEYLEKAGFDGAKASAMYQADQQAKVAPVPAPEEAAKGPEAAATAPAAAIAPRPVRISTPKPTASGTAHIADIEGAPAPSVPEVKTTAKVIEGNEKLPTDAMAILNQRVYQTLGSEIPEHFWEEMTADKLVQGLGKLGLDEEVLREANGALYKAGYRRIGNYEITANGLKAPLEGTVTQSVSAHGTAHVSEIQPERPEVTSTTKQEYAPGPQIGGTEGNETRLLTPEGEHPARYRVVEASALQTSHDPHTFARNPLYPAGVQERAYDTSKEAQQRVIEQAQTYEPSYTINTNPDAVNGPPVITPDGIVLGGNSRAMSTRRLYKAGNGKRYKAALAEQAQSFGLDQDRVRMMKEPVLVREIQAPQTLDEMRQLGSRLNKSMTGALGVSERAVSAGKSIKRESLANISGMLDNLGDSASLRDLMRERGADLVRILVADGAITPRERPQFVDTATGGLSEEGKTFVERALLGSVVDDPRLMDSTPKSVLNKLDGSLAALSSIAPRTDAYNILPLVRAALRDHAEIASKGTNVETFLGQSGMFGPERNPAIDALVRLLADKPTVVKQKLRQFAKDAGFDVQGQGTLGLVEQPSPASAFNEAFGTNLTDEQLEASILQSLQSGPIIGVPHERTVQSEAKSGSRTLQQPASRAAGKSRTGTGESPAVEGKAQLSPRVVPGARSAKTGSETGTTSIQDLTEAIRRQVPAKRTLKDRLNRGADIGESVSGARDSLGRALARIEGAVGALWDAYARPPKWTDYEDATGKWSGADQINALDLERFTNAIKRVVPDKLKREAISNWIEAGGDEDLLTERAAKSAAPYRTGYEAALNLTDAEQTVARNIMNRNDATLEEARRAGLLQQGVENYVRHIYADNPKMVARVMAEMNFSSLQTKPSFTKKRVLPTYFDAEQLGFKPKNKDIGFLTASHERAFREALAARDYVRSLMEGKALDGRPLVVTSWASAKELPAAEAQKSAAYLVKPNIKPDEEYADYRRIDHPALRGWRWSGKSGEGEPIFVQGDAFVHPEIYTKLKNNLSKSAIRSYEFEIGGHVFHPGAALLNVSSEIKHAILSFSGFHQTTLGIHALEHRTAPASMPELDLSKPKQRFLVDHGLMVAQYDAAEAFGEGLASGGLVTKIPAIGPAYHAYVDYLFKDYLPRVKMAMALNALERNTRLYASKLSQDEIGALTAREANAAFGGLNYKLLGRNKTLQDVLRLAFMAPDFTEARARFVGQAAKPYGREQLYALLGGALVLYTVARILNDMLDRDAHWDKPFTLVYDGKEYSMRTVPSDLFRALSEPGQYVKNRLSPLASTAVQIAEGRDRFGKKQSLGQLARDVGRSEVPIPLQPWTKETDDPAAKKAISTILKMVGVNEAIAKTRAEKLAADIYAESYGSDRAMTPKEKERYLARRHIIDEGEKGNWQPLWDARSKGLFDQEQVRQMQHDVHLGPLAARVHHFSYPDFMRVYDVATPEEKKQLEPIRRRKQIDLMRRGKRAEVTQAEAR